MLEQVMMIFDIDEVAVNNEVNKKLRRLEIIINTEGAEL
jgi:hypothetical protein